MITSEEKRVSNELSPADCVSIPDLKAEGAVFKQHESPRSVVIQTLNGQVRRNRRMTWRVLEERPPVSPLNEGSERREPTQTRERNPNIPSALEVSQEDCEKLSVPEDQPEEQSTRLNCLELCSPFPWSGSICYPGILLGIQVCPWRVRQHDYQVRMDSRLRFRAW